MELNKRMKECYENRFRNYLPRRTYTIIRIDGKNFSRYTKNLDKPFDRNFSDNMISTTKFLMENIQGAKVGYVQSDEISILVTDFDTYDTCAWFDNNIQKIVSVSSSMATAKFNSLQNINKLAFFDSRCFIIPSIDEVVNYFKWRFGDCVTNSVFGFAQTYFSSKELFKKGRREVLTLCEENGYFWNELDDTFKNGTFVFFEKNNNNIKEIKSVNNKMMGNDISIFKYLKEFIIPKY